MVAGASRHRGFTAPRPSDLFGLDGLRQRQPQALGVVRLHFSYLAPPYQEAVPFPPEALARPKRLPFGSLVALPVRGSVADVSDLRRLVRKIRGMLPGFPVVLLVSRDCVSNSMASVLAAGRFGVRAVLIEGEPFRPVLSRYLPNPEDLSSDLLEWLALRGVACSGHVGDHLRALFASYTFLPERTGPPQCQSVPSRTLRAWFARAGLPSPHRWCELSAGLQAGLAIQRNPDRPIAHVALERGFSHASALARYTVRVFGIRASAIRGILGWEPLVDSWIQRQDRMAPLLESAGISRVWSVPVASQPSV